MKSLYVMSVLMILLTGCSTSLTTQGGGASTGLMGDHAASVTHVDAAMA
jgi:hypothetical protein